MDGKETELKLLEGRIATLERQVNFLLRINGLDLSALREASDQELLEHYQNAVRLLGIKPQAMPLEVAERWSELFLQLSELECVRLQTLVEYDHTWEPFYELCIRLQTRLRKHEDFATDPRLKELYAVLDRGRRNLQSVALIMLQKHPQELPYRAKVLLQPELPLI